MEVAYLPPSDYSTRAGSSRVRKTQSTAAEADRILNWNYDVATSNPPVTAHGPAATHRRPSVEVPRHTPGIHRGDDAFPAQRRAVPRTSSVYEPTTTPRQNSNGLSTGTVVGTLLGVAAGAAFTYSVTRDDRDHRVQPHEYDPPTFSRRSTFPDPFPEPRGRYVDIERNLERVRYPEERPRGITHRAPPEYLARYSQADPPRSRELDDVHYDSRSRHSARHRQSTRARSEAVTSRKPLLIADSERQNHVGSKHKNSPPISRSVVHRTDTYDLPDRTSHASSRSWRSAGTMRPAPRLPSPPPAPSQPQIVARSRAGSRVATTTVKVGNGQTAPRARGRAASYIPARDAGTAGIAWEDDTDSIVPNDSISCVGGRGAGRHYR